MSKKWRKTTDRYFATRPIFKEEIPNLIKSMIEDGLYAMITSEGILWFHGGYRIQKKEIRSMWNLSAHQMKRVEDYIYGNDPFDL